MDTITVSLPNGATINFPAGTSPETIRQVAEQALGKAQNVTPGERMHAAGYRSPNPSEANAQAAAGIQSSADQNLIGKQPVMSRVAKAIQGLPFVGEYFDEAVGALGGGERREHVRAIQDAMERENPNESMALRLGGGIAGTVAALPAALPVATAGAAALGGTTGAAVIAGGAAGAAGGAIEGAVSGYGAGEGDERGSSAGRGAALGGALGGGLGALAPLIAKGGAAVIERLKGTDIAGIQKLLGVSPEAAQAVKVGLASEDPYAAMARLSRAGPDAMLVEAGPATLAMGKGAASSGGEATRIMRGAVDQRMAAGAQDVRGALDAAFPKSEVPPRPKADLRRLYDTAYRTPIDYSTEAGQQIEDLMERVPGSYLQKAWGLIEMDPDIPNDIKKQILAKVAPGGAHKLTELPSTIELDYITRALNDVAKKGDGKGALGGNTNEGRIYGKLSGRIRSAMKEANPAYAEALDAAGTEIGIKEADDFGYKAMRPSTRWQDVEEALSGAPKIERDTMKQAVRQHIDDTLANVRRIMSQPGTETGEAIKVLRDLSSRSSREKLGVILGKTEADHLAARLDTAGAAFELGANLSRNSDTAVNQAVQGSIKDSSADGPLRLLGAGEPVEAAKRLVQIITGQGPEARAAREGKVFAELARALTNTKGVEAQMAISGINKLVEGQRITSDEAHKLANTIVSALGVGGYAYGRGEIAVSD